jgi:hypothetical protein
MPSRLMLAGLAAFAAILLLMPAANAQDRVVRGGPRVHHAVENSRPGGALAPGFSDGRGPEPCGPEPS